MTRAWDELLPHQSTAFRFFDVSSGAAVCFVRIFSRIRAYIHICICTRIYMYLDILLFFSFFFFSLPFFFVTEQNRFVECSTQVLYILPADISYVLRESSVKREQMRSVLASTAQRENGRVFVGLNH